MKSFQINYFSISCLMASSKIVLASGAFSENKRTVWSVASRGNLGATNLNPISVDSSAQTRSPASFAAAYSFNLEDARNPLIDMAKERNALLFANASGSRGMPQNANERVDHLTECMEIMDKGGIPMEDRLLDPLVFPVGAGPEFGTHYLDAVKQLRIQFPDVHIFGGHSNVSFGLPDRKLINQTFLELSIMAGCDSVMIDPVMNDPADLNAFYFSYRALIGADQFCVDYLKYVRGKIQQQ